MNLTISPVNVNSHSSNFNNIKNNQNQNFGALKAEFQPMQQRFPMPRIAEKTLATFLGCFEKSAKKLGFNTEKLEQKGYKLLLDSDNIENLDAGFLDGRLVNRHGNAVKRNGIELDVKIDELCEERQAQDYVQKLIKAGIIA